MRAKADVTEQDIKHDAQLGLLLEALKEVRNGDFSVQLPEVKEGIMAEITEVFNDIVSLDRNTTSEIIRVRKTVGEGAIERKLSYVSP